MRHLDARLQMNPDGSLCGLTIRCRRDGPDGPRPELKRYGLVLNKSGRAVPFQRANFREFYREGSMRAGRSSVSPRGEMPFPRERVRKQLGGGGKGSLVARQRASPARQRLEHSRPARLASSAGASIRRL